MTGAPGARAQRRGVCALVALAAVAASVAAFAPPAAARPRQPRIVNGVATHDFPATGVLLRRLVTSAEKKYLVCSGTLVGCRTFVTAAHCLDDFPYANNYRVFLQHAGVLPVERIARHPDWHPDLSNYPFDDVAVLTLGAPATGVAPAAIALADPAPLIPHPGTIVGYGRTGGGLGDYGIKHAGQVETAACDSGSLDGAGDAELVCWDFASPVGPPGEDSNTCNGDSGGSLFMDLGAGDALAGITSGGLLASCGVGDHSFDTSVFRQRIFVLGRLGADSAATCGTLPPVGDPEVSVLGFDGTLDASDPADDFTLEVGPGKSALRVTLNTLDDFAFDADVFVRFGAPPTADEFDCAINGATAFGACDLFHPAAGTWHVRVARTASSGDGAYQVTAVVFGGTPAVCGNGVVETGEDCEAADDAGCATLCQADCRCPPPVCGNAVVEAGETCDDGDRVGGDGCSYDCHVELGPQPQDKAQQACVNEMNRALAKVTNAQGKEIQACVGDAAKDRLAGMTVEACVVADRSGRVARYAARTVAGESRRCLAASLPDFAYTDAATVNAAGTASALGLAHDVFGPDLDAVVRRIADDRDGTACQRDVARTVERCAETRLGEFNRCKQSALESVGFTTALALEVCLDADPRHRVARDCDRAGARPDRLRATIDRKCVRRGVGLAAALPGCGTDDPAALHACLAAATACRACRALGAADGLGRDCDVFDDARANGSCP